MKKSFLLTILSIGIYTCSISQSIHDQRTPVNHINLEGYIDERLESSVQNRILAQDVDRLINAFDPNKRTETHMWQSEFWGKWFTSAVLAYKYKPSDELFKTLEKAVYGLMEQQTADGYIGNYAADKRLQQWDVWGRKYCLLGLLSFYEIKPDNKVLQAAEKLAQNLMDDLQKADGILVTKGNYRGMAASSVLEPICKLYVVTNNKKYLEFAETIVKQWSRPDGPQLIEKSKVNVAERFEKPSSWYSWEQGQKAYEMMSCYEGLLELYRITGNPTYKEAVINTWDNIKATEINIAGSGASTEMWFGGKALQADPVHHYKEVCVTVTWIKLCLQLFRLTGENKYAEEAEYAYYNALLGSLSKDGAQWAKYTPLNGQRLPGSEQCGMGLNCCEASGPRALFLMPFYTVTQENNAVQVNYFIPGAYDIQIGKQKAQLIIQTDYPKSSTVSIGLKSNKPIDVPIEIRIPSWSEESKIAFNHVNVEDNIEPNTYYQINKKWKGSDVINLELDLNPRILKTGDQVQSLAIMRGPIVLSRDAMFAENIPVSAVLTPVINKNNRIELVETENPNSWMSFKAKFIPESYSETGSAPVELQLCDYASAGNMKPLTYFQTWFPQLINKSK